ncbi:hypothetical protein HPB50_007334 [Hyalomma asiaticum]|uniref:Uncharacterized protein n=1 Tax=Hyalomma asiaticum TaxID=266040 RepID=A0ACB7SSP0_HYAAI|nr:hypothetical protein HPB50_007334 [Hyalomma asiaticum]
MEGDVCAVYQAWYGPVPSLAPRWAREVLPPRAGRLLVALDSGLCQAVRGPSRGGGGPWRRRWYFVPGRSFCPTPLPLPLPAAAWASLALTAASAAGCGSPTSIVALLLIERPSLGNAPGALFVLAAESSLLDLQVDLQRQQHSDQEPWITQTEVEASNGSLLTTDDQIVRLRASVQGTVVEVVPLMYAFCSKAEILSIVADLDTLGEILLNIIPKLDDRSMQFAQHTGQNGGSESEMRLLMHQSHAGCIIGRAGCRIKELRESTGANIKVHGSCCPGSTERIVKVTGSPSVVVDCIKQICDIVGGAPIKGLNKPYDPHNFDPEFAQEYGGFPEGAAGGASGGGGALGGMSVGPARGSSTGSSRSGSMSFWRDEPVDAFARGRGPKRGPWGEASPQLPPHAFADEPARPWHSPPSLSSGGMHRKIKGCGKKWETEIGLVLLVYKGPRMYGFRLTCSLATSHSCTDVGVSDGSVQAAAEKVHTGNNAPVLERLHN